MLHHVRRLCHFACNTALSGIRWYSSDVELPVQNGNENGTVDEPRDEPSDEPQGLQEPETEDIKTVSAGNTIYSSATSFEDLQLSPELLQVEQSFYSMKICLRLVGHAQY